MVSEFWRKTGRYVGQSLEEIGTEAAARVRQDWRDLQDRAERAEAIVESLTTPSDRELVDQVLEILRDEVSSRTEMAEEIVALMERRHHCASCDMHSCEESPV